MLGAHGFDCERLFSEPDFVRFSLSAVASIAAGSVQPLRDSLGSSPGDAGIELAAFAASSQGIAPLLAALPNAGSLPSDVAVFLASERVSSSARGAKLRRTLRETVAALREAGVEVVAMKGAVLANFHYAEPALRPMGDLDLLLREPRDLGRATAALSRAGWRPHFDTPRHRVFVKPDERVVRPATEDPENPIRVEVHTSFRLPVLGRVYDASAALRAEAETRDLDGTPVAIAAGPALLRHLLLHAAEDFAGNGIRGIQAHDFRLLAARAEKLVPEISTEERGNAGAPLWFAASAIERLFPDTFEEAFLKSLESGVSATVRARAVGVPTLRYTRPAQGWSRTLLSLVEGPVPRARFLRRTLFPTLGEVKANAAPDASGPRLAAAWVGVLARRVARSLER